MDLTRAEVLRLLAEYKKHPILWDPHHKMYFNKPKKKEAWIELSKCVKISKDEARRKIWSLLGSFRREKTKGKKIIGTGADAKEVYKSDWFAFNSLKFLIEHKSGETSTCIHTKNENIEPEDTEQSNDSSINIPQGPEITRPVEQAEEKQSHSSSIPRKRAKIFIREGGSQEPHPIQKVIEFVNHPEQEEDNTAIYAKYLATKLNQFDPRTKSILIHKINELVFDTEMSTLYPPDS